MADIVERLRTLAKPGMSLQDAGGASVFSDAADEIQRLRERESLWMLCAARTADVYGGCFQPQPDLVVGRLRDSGKKHERVE